MHLKPTHFRPRNNDRNLKSKHCSRRYYRILSLTKDNFSIICLHLVVWPNFYVDKSNVEKSIKNTGEEVGLFFKWCFSKGLQITSNKNQLLTCSLMFRLMNHFNQNTRRKEEVPLQNNIKEKKVFRQKINGYVSVKMVDQVFLKSGKHVH